VPPVASAALCVLTQKSQVTATVSPALHGLACDREEARMWLAWMSLACPEKKKKIYADDINIRYEGIVYSNASIYFRSCESPAFHVASHEYPEIRLRITQRSQQCPGMIVGETIDRTALGTFDPAFFHRHQTRSNGDREEEYRCFSQCRNSTWNHFNDRSEIGQWRLSGMAPLTDASRAG